MTVKKISVVLTCYREPSSWVSSAIWSVINQSVLPYEIIIIDDSGTGSYKSDITNISKTKIIPIKYVQNTRNLGLIESLNKGLHLSEGDYIARMDADDISMPNRFKAQKELLSNGFDIVGCSVIKFSTNYNNYKCIRYPRTKFGVLLGILFNNPLAHPSVMYKSEVIKELGGYDMNALHCEDYALWCRAISLGFQITNTHEAHLFYRVHNNSVSHVHKTIQSESARNAKREFIKNYAWNCFNK